MAHDTPYIQNGHLIYQDEGQEQRIALESSAWQLWLDQSEATTFRFLHPQGNFTARREWKKSGWYWYAYRKQHGRLYKAYLGKAGDLTLSHLQSTTIHLNEQITGKHIATITHANQLSTHVSRSERAISQPIHSSSLTLDDGMLSSMGQLLLETKLFPPLPRSNYVARPHLIARLNTGLHSKLTLLSAPAGFGKSTLLSAWCHAYTGEHVQAWLSLDQDDNDALRFWRYVLATLQKQFTRVGLQAEDYFSLLSSSSLETLPTLLINILTRAERDITLILDDYHLISNTSIHEMLSFLLEHLPPRLHLVIASRTDPPLPLTRLRAQGHLNELHTADLRFSNAEVQIFLNQVMKLDLSIDEIATLDRHAEGWIAGLQLAALSMQGHKEKTTFITSFTGSHRYILDYFTSEVLQRQPEHVQNFLLQTSILQRLSAPLCDTILERSDGQEMLEHLEHANLFIMPLDEHRQWYRYHHIFAEFLQERLHNKQPELLPQLHRKACDWYEHYGLITPTMKHALEAGDMEHMVDLLERFARPLTMRGEFTLFLRWLEEIPPSLLRHHPTLHTFKAGSLISIGRLDEADACLREIETEIEHIKKTHPAHIDRDRQEGEFLAAKSGLASIRGDLQSAITISQQALQLLPDDSFSRSIVLTGLGVAYLYSGDILSARDRFNEVMTYGEDAHHQHMLLSSMTCLGYIQTLQGHLHKGAEIYHNTINASTRQGGRFFSAISMVYSMYSQLLYEWNELDAAEHYARESIARGDHWGYIGMLAQAKYTLARIHFARGHIQDAMSQMQEAIQIAHSYTHPYIIHLVGAYSAQLALHCGYIHHALDWAEELKHQNTYQGPVSDIERITLAELAIAQNRFPEAEAILQELLRDATMGERQQAVIEGELLQVLLLMKQGIRDSALAKFARVLGRIEPEGYIHTIIDRGEPLLTLLHTLATHNNSRSVQGPSPGYVHQLLTAAGEPVTPSMKTACPLLSARERLVLQRIADGQSNQGIAKELVVALSTVKTHINNIFTKLGVHSRTQAIARARELELF